MAEGHSSSGVIGEAADEGEMDVDIHPRRLRTILVQQAGPKEGKSWGSAGGENAFSRANGSQP